MRGKHITSAGKSRWGRQAGQAAAGRSLVLMAGAAVALLAPWARAETLEEALASAYMTNPQLLAERANLRSVDEDVPQGLAGYRPNIQLQASGGRQRIVDSGAAEAGVLDANKRLVDNNGTLDAQLVQNLYNGGGTVAATAQAEDKVIAERANLVATEETVLYNVITAYYDVLRDDELLKYDHEFQEDLRQIATASRGTAQIGVMTQVDVAQTEGRLQAVTAQTNTDEGNLESDRGVYEAAVGHLPDRLVEPTLKPRIPVGLNDAVNLAAKNNPKLVSLQFTERSSRDQVAVDEAKLLPSIDLVLDRSVNSNNTPGLTQNSTSALLRLTVPFYSQGIVWSQSRQAIEAVGAAQGNTDQQRRIAVESARAAWQAETTGRSAVAALRAAVANDQKAVTGSRAQLLAGEISILDMLTVEQYLYNDQTTLARTNHDQHIAEFNLMMQIGNLTAQDIRLNVNLYDPTKHYNSVRDKLLGLDSSK